MEDNLTLEDLMAVMDDDSIPSSSTKDDVETIPPTTPSSTKELDSTRPIEKEEEDYEEEESTPPSTEDDDDDDPITTENEEESDLEKYYNILKESNLLAVDDDFKFDGTPDKLFEAIESTVKNIDSKAEQKLIDELPEDWKEAIKYAKAGGTIDRYLETFKAKELEDLDPENSADQRIILREYYKATTTFSDSKIDNLIARLAKDDALEDEAITALEDLKVLEAENRKQLALQEEEKNKAALKAQEDARKELASIIEKNITDPVQRNKTKAYFFNPITKDNQTLTDFTRDMLSIQNNKQHLAQLGQYIKDNYDPKEGFTNKKIKKVSASAAANDLRTKLAELANSSSKPKVSGKGSKIENDDFDWNTYLTQ